MAATPSATQSHTSGWSADGPVPVSGGLTTPAPAPPPGCVATGCGAADVTVAAGCGVWSPGSGVTDAVGVVDNMVYGVFVASGVGVVVAVGPGVFVATGVAVLVAVAVDVLVGRAAPVQVTLTVCVWIGCTTVPIFTNVVVEGLAPRNASAAGPGAIQVYVTFHATPENVIVGPARLKQPRSVLTVLSEWEMHSAGPAASFTEETYWTIVLS